MACLRSVARFSARTARHVSMTRSSRKGEAVGRPDRAAIRSPLAADAGAGADRVQVRMQTAIRVKRDCSGRRLLDGPAAPGGRRHPGEQPRGQVPAEGDGGALAGCGPRRSLTASVNHVPKGADASQGAEHGGHTSGAYARVGVVGLAASGDVVAVDSREVQAGWRAGPHHLLFPGEPSVEEGRRMEAANQAAGQEDVGRDLRVPGAAAGRGTSTDSTAFFRDSASRPIVRYVTSDFRTACARKIKWTHGYLSQAATAQGPAALLDGSRERTCQCAQDDKTLG